MREFQRFRGDAVLHDAEGGAVPFDGDNSDEFVGADRFPVIAEDFNGCVLTLNAARPELADDILNPAEHGHRAKPTLEGDVAITGVAEEFVRGVVDTALDEIRDIDGSRKTRNFLEKAKVF